MLPALPLYSFLLTRAEEKKTREFDVQHRLGLGCTTTSQADLPPKWHLLGGMQLTTMQLFNMKTVTVPKGGYTRQKLSTQSVTSVHLG